MSDLQELKNKKLEYLQKIYELTVKQREVLRVDDIEELQKLIDEKQKFIIRIDKLDSKINEIDREAKTNEEIRNVVQTIIEIDQENNKTANKLFFSIKQKIGKFRQAKKVHKAYNPTLTQSAFFNKAR